MDEPRQIAESLLRAFYPYSKKVSIRRRGNKLYAVVVFAPANKDLQRHRRIGDLIRDAGWTEAHLTSASPDDATWRLNP